MAEYLINTMNRQDTYLADLVLITYAIWITLICPRIENKRGLVLCGVAIVFLRHPATFQNILDSSGRTYILRLLVKLRGRAWILLEWITVWLNISHNPTTLPETLS